MYVVSRDVPLEDEGQGGLDGLTQGILPAFYRTGGNGTGWGRRRKWLETVASCQNDETEHVKRIADEKNIMSVLAAHQRSNPGH